MKAFTPAMEVADEPGRELLPMAAVVFASPQLAIFVEFVAQQLPCLDCVIPLELMALLSLALTVQQWAHSRSDSTFFQN